MAFINNKFSDKSSVNLCLKNKKPMDIYTNPWLYCNHHNIFITYKLCAGT